MDAPSGSFCVQNWTGSERLLAATAAVVQATVSQCVPCVDSGLEGLSNTQGL